MKTYKFFITIHSHFTQSVTFKFLVLFIGELLGKEGRTRLGPSNCGQGLLLALCSLITIGESWKTVCSADRALHIDKKANAFSTSVLI